MNFRKNEKAESPLILVVGVLVILILLGIGMIGYPQYKIYTLEQNGKAQLAEAEWTKKIQIEASKGKYEAAKIDSETELIKAKTLAERNQIVSKSLDDRYLKYLMITELTDGNTQQIVYIPTEAGIPILESGRVPTNTETLPK